MVSTPRNVASKVTLSSHVLVDRFLLNDRLLNRPHTQGPVFSCLNFRIGEILSR